MENSPVMEFHVSRKARDRYQFDESIFSFSGNVIFASFHAARVFAQKMNHARDLKKSPERAVKPGQITAMGLIDEAQHYIVSRYRKEVNGKVMGEILETLDRGLGRKKVEEALREFCWEFPPVSVYRGETDLDAYLRGATGETPNREIVLEEMLLLWLANMNPAFSPFIELFDDTELKKTTVYPLIITGIRKYFDSQPGFGSQGLHLVDMLRAPAIHSPDSLSGQLEYIRAHWGVLLEALLRRILKGLDIFKEEEKQAFTGPGRARVIRYGRRGFEPEFEVEEYSPDRDWMPRLVLMAKNIYVWLDQLSKKYSRSVSRLDEIPDKELDILRGQGFSGLWLIGVWERSPSSGTIKQLCGNPEAVPSAYSLYDYQIAADLGGEEAYLNLRDRTWQKGIRLASDMVPNHVGIYSRWTVEHPDWFVSLDYNPFPWYSFDGPDLSHDGRVGIFVEDHYYNRTDAAVVFKRVDRFTGSEKYVYHGNDGTSMPWNDTAQLNYLNPEVREAMIRTILHVARKFPVIRFDAAMTLAKKHYQRLWFPEPGTGGAIPTRAEFGLTREEFNEVMPAEFWREVVDRVAQEAPDTLLLAEAFWLLEGYFVRTLGMHRVYNSAFMNMLRDEDNAGYRQVMKNTLEFDPEILRRFVNFMNNPDERTAVDQFGKEDKYFGVCLLMATLPGLPMFGHGQIEGFEEKYGMEYRCAYYDETPDGYLVERHERDIFPLLHRRYLFAGVEHFYLYDFFTSGGGVNEDVYAYSNRHGDERVLVLYHNRFADTAGWVRTSAAYSVKTGKGDARTLVQKTVGEGLGLNTNDRFFTVFRDHGSNLLFLRPSRQIHEEGLYAELGAYGAHVFLDFREVEDNEWNHYSQLASWLGGRGFSDLDRALQEMLLQPLLNSFRDLVNPHALRRLADAAINAAGPERRSIPGPLLDEIEEKAISVFREAKAYTQGSGDEHTAALDMRLTLERLLLLPPAAPDGSPPRPGGADAGAKPGAGTDPVSFYTLLTWVLVKGLCYMTDEDGTPGEGRPLIGEWLLGPVIAETFRSLGMEDAAAERAAGLVKLLVAHHGMLSSPSPLELHQRLSGLFASEEAKRFLQVNEYEMILWFSRDGFKELVRALLATEFIGQHEDAGKTGEKGEHFATPSGLAEHLLRISERSGYRVFTFLEIMKNETGIEWKRTKANTKATSTP